MRILIASDLHGAASCVEKLIARFNEGGYDRLLLLGDSLYHGPRNTVPADYDCPKTAELLNSVKEKIWYVRGNCDGEVDQMMLNFPITSDYIQFALGETAVFASHGHVYGLDNRPPAGSCDILLCGHTHLPGHQELPEGFVYCNPGSTSIPKGGSKESYMTYEDNTLFWRYLENGEVYDQLAL